MSRREDKKAETKFALARAAANLTIASGIDGATVAEIAKNAHVSTRTFHNYFDTRDDALRFYMQCAIHQYGEAIERAPKELNLLDTVEYIMLNSIREDDENLESVAKLFALGQQYELLKFNPNDPEIAEITGCVQSLYRKRYPEMAPYQVDLITIISTQSLAALLIQFLHGGLLERSTANAERLIKDCVNILRVGFAEALHSK
ncbi:TetR/AcrR family transcriptional regulator [Corynebacterium sp. H128]|uniref:TetR/AcrR family transcriptional regulator n=1 Tax=unclassified Corynebacterium TaxID=2624378 RepID=UPI00309FD0C2